MAAENGAFGGSFRRPFHRTPTRGPRRFRLLRQALAVASLHVQAGSWLFFPPRYDLPEPFSIVHEYSDARRPLGQSPRPTKGDPERRRPRYPASMALDVQSRWSSWPSVGGVNSACSSSGLLSPAVDRLPSLQMTALHRTPRGKWMPQDQASTLTRPSRQVFIP